MARKPDVQYIRLYTDGSAARKVAPVEPWKTARLPKVKRSKKIVIHIDPIATLGLIVAAVMLTLMLVGIVQMKQAKHEAAVMEAYVDTLREKNEALRTEYEAGYDLEEIERMALALGMVPMDEVQHITIDMPQVQLEQPEPGTWQRVWTFLTGLFA
jgi:hypothetical protein